MDQCGWGRACVNWAGPLSSNSHIRMLVRLPWVLYVLVVLSLSEFRPMRYRCSARQRSVLWRCIIGAGMRFGCVWEGYVWCRLAAHSNFYRKATTGSSSTHLSIHRHVLSHNQPVTYVHRYTHTHTYIHTHTRTHARTAAPRCSRAPGPGSSPAAPPCRSWRPAHCSCGRGGRGSGRHARCCRARTSRACSSGGVG